MHTCAWRDVLTALNTPSHPAELPGVLVKTLEWYFGVIWGLGPSWEGTECFFALVICWPARPHGFRLPVGGQLLPLLLL